jgi:hypothetical protein
MDPMNVLGTLSQAKDLITEGSPNALDRFAEITGLVSEAAKEMSNWLKVQKSGPPVMLEHIPAGTEEAEDLESFSMIEPIPVPLKATEKLGTEQADELVKAFDSFYDSIEKMAAMPAILLRTLQKDKAKVLTMIPVSFQVALAKLILSVTDDIVGELHGIVNSGGNG